MKKTLLSFFILSLVTFTLANSEELKKEKNKPTVVKKEKLTKKQQEVYNHLKELEKKAENSKMFDILDKPPKNRFY